MKKHLNIVTYILKIKTIKYNIYLQPDYKIKYIIYLLPNNNNNLKNKINLLFDKIKNKYNIGLYPDNGK